jgi:sensor histidine kinase YesM
VHPILSDRRRLALYVLGWLTIGVLLTVSLARPGEWLTAAAIFLPTSVLFAFISLSAWYLCQVFPIRAGSNPWRTLFVQLATVAMASAIWIASGQAWAMSLDAVTSSLDADAYFSQRRALLFVVGALLFALSIVIHYLFIAFEASREADRRALELTVLTRDAELRAIRAQIDPHFLFNSLHSISALTAADAPGARRMCLLLADFLRDTLRLGSGSRIPLADELALAERFLEIERVRLGARLQVTCEADTAAASCLVPPLLLQPLVENAVVHGIGQLVDGGRVSMTACRDASTLTIAIDNPCDPDRRPSRGSGLGLELLRKRVAAQFGADGSVRVDGQPDHFRVEVRIPATTEASTTGD